MRDLQEKLGVELRPSARPAGQEANDRAAGLDRGVLGRDVEQVGERDSLLARVVGEQPQLRDPELVRRLEHVLEPLARRVHLEPVTGVRRDERPPAAVLLDAELLVDRPLDHGEELVLVERESEVVDARELPLARLDDDVDGAALELAQTVLEADLLEVVPRRPGLVGDDVLADPPVPRDQLESELADVARLPLRHLARDEVVVKQLHGAAIVVSASVGSDLSLWASWSFDPLQLAPTVLIGIAYAKRVRTLRRRGTDVPGWRVALFGLGLVLLVLALASPIDRFGDEQFFSFHMLQHVLIGDLAPLCLLAGLTGPILRPVLALRPIERLRVLVHPAISLPLWTANLFLWHIPVFYEAALASDAVHALQHISFFTAGAVMWAPVVEVLPGPAWFGTAAKLGYIVVVRLLETLLGNVFLWAGGAFYDPYIHPTEMWGISADADQGIAGAVMMAEGSLVTLAALAWLFLRLAREGELRQELIERGLDPASVNRAVRYGRGTELSERR